MSDFVEKHVACRNEVRQPWRWKLRYTGPGLVAVSRHRYRELPLRRTALRVRACTRASSPSRVPTGSPPQWCRAHGSVMKTVASTGLIRWIDERPGDNEWVSSFRRRPLFRSSDRPWSTKLKKQSDIAEANCARGFPPIRERGGLCSRIYRLCSTDDVFRGHYSSTLRTVGVNDFAMSPCRSIAALLHCVRAAPNRVNPDN
jgi:hypothetical protein